MMRTVKLLAVLLVSLGVLALAACTQAQPSPTAAPTKPVAAAATATAPAAAATKPAATTGPAAAATKPAGAASPAATAPTAGGPPQIPASHQPIAQRQDCLSCHKQDGFMPAPASHQGRTSQTCQGCHQAAAAGTPPVVALAAAKVDTAPNITGQGTDAAWAKAKPATVRVSGGVNKSQTDVTLKVVYTADTVYFQAQYKDPTESMRRRPWQKQADGTWKQLGKSAIENTYYEDKFAMIWNINDAIKDFNTQGCAVTCHATTAGRDRPLKYTNAPGELGDIWHGKFVRTLPVGQLDDQYLDNDQKSEEAGRKSDPNTGGGYKDNATQGQSVPPYALPDNKPAPPYVILDSQKVPFDDSKYKANDEVPGIYTAPYQGDRGDIAAKNSYKDGTWTLEWSRKLSTGSQYDVQFNDLKKSYFFGVAVFDNTQIGHGVQYGVTKFTFE